MRFSQRSRAAPTAIAAAVLLLVGAPEAAAQQSVPLSELPRVEQDRITLEEQSRMQEAEELYRRGKEHWRQGEWRRAAVHFENAAGLRGEGDMKTARLYRKAGDAFFLAGKEGRAVSNFERAAESALRFGDVDLAAGSYLRAALVAVETGDLVRANQNGWKAQRLSGSPALSPEVRQSIREHLQVGEPTVALGSGSQQ